MGGVWGGNWTNFIDRPHCEFTGGLNLRALQSGVFLPASAQMLWELDQEDDSMTQDKFNKMMDVWVAARRALPVSGWAKDELNAAIMAKVTDGTAPQGFATREQVAVMIVRAGWSK
jgi:hypothetical protein